MEEFRDIEGYKGKYQVSSLGIVKSLNYNHTGKEKILKPGKNTCGYLYVALCNEGKYKHCYVHRLVANAFIENPNNFNEVNHIDENKENNSADNLEWCSRKYNMNFGTRNEKVRTALSKPVKCIETGVVFPSTHQAARQTGVTQASISHCCLGKKKTAGGFHWQYI